MKTFKLNSSLPIYDDGLKELHLESTDACHAACPLCPRQTDYTFDKSKKHHLTINQITKHFPDNIICGLNKMFMCGNYGDPAAGRYTLDIYNYFRNLNPNIILGMNTNGALQSAKWWFELAKILNGPQDYVVFSIDGVGDTNALYRVNTDWNTLINNAETFIAAGGRAHWDMLIYKHNQHQVAEAELFAKNMGFKWFRAKVSKRELVNGLELPTGWELPKQEIGSIKCQTIKNQSAYLDARGRVSPCCWIGCTQQYAELNFADIQSSWSTEAPNSICSANCSLSGNNTTFANQWRKEIEF